MSVMHELEKRADQHRVEALKKIDAVAQEYGDDGSFSGEANSEVTSNSVEVEELAHSGHPPSS
jgi:hypothetical protein